MACVVSAGTWIRRLDGRAQSGRCDKCLPVFSVTLNIMQSAEHWQVVGRCELIARVWYFFIFSPIHAVADVRTRVRARHPA